MLSIIDIIVKVILYLISFLDTRSSSHKVLIMSSPRTSFTNHFLLEAELSPKVNIAMSTEELPEDNSSEVSRKLTDQQ